ncbi:hypothetical protein KAR28_04260 [Candidatus Parcubacteria bacterium]|nr:hypothetical protein [Candidatus Parcubacteria bacterium]
MFITKPNKKYWVCTYCKKNKLKKWRKDNPKSQSDWKEKNRKKIRIQQKQYYKKNINEQRKRSMKKYYKYKKDNPEIVKYWYTKFYNTPKGKFARYKMGAKKRGIEFKITLDDFVKLWKKPCFYCGCEIDQIGIDRVDNQKGYTVENIQSCCGWCNVMKNKYTEKEFIEKCKTIAKRS